MTRTGDGMDSKVAVVTGAAQGIGAAVVGACWLSVTLLGGDEAKAAHELTGKRGLTHAESPQAPVACGTDAVTGVGLDGRAGRKNR